MKAAPAKSPSALLAEPRPPVRRQSMMLSVLAVLVVVGLVPLVFLGWRVAGSLSAQLANNQKEVLLDKGDTIAEQIVQFVDEHFGRLEVMADAFSRLSASAAAHADDAAARQLLENYVDTSDVLELRLVSTGPGHQAVRAFSPSFDADAIAADLDPEVAAALEKGGRGLRYLSVPFMPKARAVPQMLAVFAVPVKPPQGAQDAVVSRVLVGVVSLAYIEERVQHVGGALAAGNYAVFVLDDNLRPFAHTEYQKVIERADLTTTSELVQDYAKYPLDSAKSQPFVEKQANGTERAMLGSYRPVTPEGRRWGVFVQVDRAAGLSQVRAMWATTFESAFLAFLLAVVIGVAFSLRLTGPVHALSESTRRVASGEYGRTVRVRTNDELGMLADNFNQMSQNIRSTIDELQRQHEINDQLFMSSIRSLAAAIDARDPYTRGHSERVTRYSRIIARQIGLGVDQMRDVEIGALLHDVGKIGIEDRILRKPAALTPEEFEIMKTHPEKGGDIMEPIAALRGATEIIIHHHERWDGTGYPSGLAGEEIPLGARIVSVADTFDAMTTNRPYQRAMTFAVAARKIGEFAGKACDPRVVVAFQAAFESGAFGGAQAEPRVRAGDAPA